MVSVIVPCFNHEKYIDSFIDSILAQTMDDAEIIICDDCSRDRSWDRILNRQDELNKKLKNVKLLRHEENKGITITLNDMLRLAKGEWVKPVASDDILDPEYLETVDHVFRNNKNAGVVVTNGFFINEDEKYPLSQTDRKRFYETFQDFSAPDFFDKMYECNRIFAPGAAVRSDVYKKCGLYDEDLAVEDWEFWLRALVNKVSFYYVDEELCYYRISETSMTSLKNTPGLEKKNLINHYAEWAVINKFKDYVSKRTYSGRKLVSIEKLYWFSKANKFEESIKVAEKEFKEYNGWRHLGIKKFAGFIFRTCKNKILGEKVCR